MSTKRKGKESSERKKRRSIEHDAPEGWVGWDRIEALQRRAEYLDDDTQQRSLYFTTIFITGGRIGEVVTLRPNQIRSDDKIIKIENMEVFKRRRRFTRTVFIKRKDNPLADIFIKFVEACETDYLLPGYGSPFSTEIDPTAHISTTHVYKRIVSIDPNIWPHWIRDQRSWHLSAPEEKGGRGFDAYLLKVWFEWASMEMPAYYAGRRKEKDILEALGVEDI